MQILVIDDDPDQRFLIVRELERAFSDLQAEEIIDAESFERALDAGRFDLTVTDYRLRWTNGLEILRALKSRYPDRPVIMFTDTGSQEIAVEAMKSGLDDYILKSPKHYVRLSAAVRSVLQQAETKRRANLLEIRLQSLLDRLNVGVFRVAADARLLEANRAFLRLLGIETLTDEQIDRLIHLFSHQSELSPGQMRERELEINRADGHSIWVLISETLSNTNGETVIDGLLEDITGAKRSEEALKRYARRIQTLQELDRSILQARSLIDIAQPALQAVAPLVNCELLSITLFDFELQQVTVLAAQPPDGMGLQIGQDFAVQDFPAIANLQQNKIVLIEDLSQLPQTAIWQGAIAAGIRSVMSVPVRAESELIGSLNVGATRLEALNEETVEIAQEVANQLAIAIQQSRLREQLHRYMERLEQLVSSRTQQLEEANRDLEAFTYSVSHDLREPLRALQGYTQILSEDYGQQLDSEGQTFVSRIRENSERMYYLLQDLLTYSRLGRSSVSLQPVNLGRIVQDVLSQQELQLQAKQAQVRVEEPLINVIGHYTTLVQVITNLLTNAIKFVAPDVQPQVSIWTERRNGWVRLWVEDNGIGIEPRHQERIFRVFERLHSFEIYPGTGAGLAIVRKGIECMSGTVGVESAMGQGSRFWIELPSMEN